MNTSTSAPQDRRFFTRQPTVGASTAAKAVVDDLRGLVQAEVALARAELQSSLRDKAARIGLFAAAAAAGWLALQGLLITLGFVIALFLPGWVAALIVTALLGVVAGIAALIGRRRLATRVSVDTTKQNVQEDLALAKAHLGRG